MIPQFFIGFNWKPLLILFTYLLSVGNTSPTGMTNSFL
ncbi:hypothetical protein QM1_1005 [Clostridioides difficile DA00212]|nr:hypothetical protein QM1_1005 [Clostridioides difficile DA00212]